MTFFLYWFEDSLVATFISFSYRHLDSRGKWKLEVGWHPWIQSPLNTAGDFVFHMNAHPFNKWKMTQIILFATAILYEILVLQYRASRFSNDPGSTIQHAQAGQDRTGQTVVLCKFKPLKAHCLHQTQDGILLQMTLLISKICTTK